MLLLKGDYRLSGFSFLKPTVIGLKAFWILGFRAPVLGFRALGFQHVKFRGVGSMCLMGWGLKSLNPEP